MKYIIYNLLVLMMFLLTAVSCRITEDMRDCIPSQIRLDFEYIEIYDTGDREIVFNKVTDELELLFYNEKGELVYDLSYTAAKLMETLWWVFLDEEEIHPGNYTLLALVNYNNAHYTVSGKEKLETLLTNINSDFQGQVTNPITDTYFGKYQLELDYEEGETDHKIMLSKNTNLVSIKVIFQDEDDYKSIIELNTRITGNNEKYDWNNNSVSDILVHYLPYQNQKDDGEMSYTDFNKTMRIWHGADIKLPININSSGIAYTETLNIPADLLKIEKYNTDEKLEHYDEFYFEITLAKEFVIISITLNGWFLIENPVEL